MAIGAGTICGAEVAATKLCVWLKTVEDVENPVSTLLRMLVLALSKRAGVRFLADGGWAGVLRDFIIGIVLIA